MMRFIWDAALQVLTPKRLVSPAARTNTNTNTSAMVSERNRADTSAGGTTSSASSSSSQRQPLANINARMQSTPPQNAPLAGRQDPQLKPPTQPEFGKASPIRNPLRKAVAADPFIPRSKPTVQRPPESHSNRYYVPAPQSQPHAMVQAPFVPPEQRAFYMPGQPRPPTIPPAPRPVFSSLGEKTYFQTVAPKPPRNVIDLTKNDDDRFDPDAAIRSNSKEFGSADPYTYVDSGKASENIKNLLEGAFDEDEEDRSKTRLRSRAKKANKAEKVEAEKKAQSLADKLAALNVQDKEEEKEKEAPEGEAEEEEEEEDGTVEGLTVKLLPHQVDGVSWMIDKEIGMRKKSGVLPHGGILADDMGLGKTVQSVALLLTNPRPGPDAKPEHPKQKMPGKEVSKGTLVVAPLALIKQWEGEIKSKVTRSHALKVLVHHGPGRTKSAAELKRYDVVITTYQILASEHAGSNMEKPDGARVGCFGVHWYRMILDEAHTIKNRNAKSTLACCALESWYRWCLTGTPMQNNLDELQSLIKFLRIKPYCNLPEWKTAITQPMKNGRGGIAIRRLQYFLKAFMKRRTKDILKKEGALNFGGKADKDGEPKKGGMQIVKREVFTTECEFDEAEAEFYDRLQARAENRLKDMMEDTGKTDYIGALVILLRLRQACNHPHLIEMAMNKDKDAMSLGGGATQSGTQTPGKNSKADHDDMDDLAALMGGVTVQNKNCDVCQIELSSTESKDGVRCNECEADLKNLRAKEKTKKSSSSKKKTKVVKTEVKKEVKKESKSEQPRGPRTMRNRRVLLDSEDEDEEEGEWIGEGSEQQIDLGKAGGTDDEDAEGGGDTLGSLNSDTDEEGSQTESGSEQEDESDDDTLPIISGLAPSHKPSHKPSTKIRHLLRILHRETPDHKTIVFSQFTSMLDLIEPHLKHGSIGYVRYDGSMRPDAREASLNSLRNDPKTRVLLCSLKCGSLGLNLTAASRVVIVEPFWNPFVEEQAIDRVHRLNQPVDVKVFRLTVRNTVEEKILALQEKKRQLAAAALEGGKGVGKLSMQDIMQLFRRDAEVAGDHEHDAAFAEKFGGDTKILDSSGGRAESRPGSSTPPERAGRVVAKKGVAKKPDHAVFGRRW
jgi:SNF2 family DNA or RNA helicase